MSLLAAAAIASGVAAPMLLSGDAGQTLLAHYRGWQGQDATDRTVATRDVLVDGDVTASLSRVALAVVTPAHAAVAEPIPAATPRVGTVIEVASVSINPDPPAPPVMEAPVLSASPVLSGPPALPLPEPALAASPSPVAVVAAAPPVSIQLPSAGPAAPSATAVDVLVARAHDLLDHGNIAGARLVLERAAAGRDGRALMALAETYDPTMLARWGARGVQGDVGKARDLYREAAGRGIAEARARVIAFR